MIGGRAAKALKRLGLLRDEAADVETGEANETPQILFLNTDEAVGVDADPELQELLTRAFNEHGYTQDDLIDSDGNPLDADGIRRSLTVEGEETETETETESTYTLEELANGED